MIDASLFNSVFDVVLIGFSDKPARCAQFIAEGLTYCMLWPHPIHWTLGTVGVLRFDDDGICRRFVPYPDQRLRRAPGRDDAKQRRWGWAIDDRTVSVRAGLVPGLAGAVVRDTCERVEVPIPPEFVQRCEQHSLEPIDVLRAFIADVARITDSRLCPREDEFCSGGVEERFFADEYFSSVCRYLAQSPRASPIIPISTAALTWLNQLAPTLPDTQQKQLAEILHLARGALCMEGFTRFATVGIHDIDIALEGLPTPSMIS